MTQRRRFLKSALACLLLPAGVLHRRVSANSAGLRNRRLVLIELAGANDGLNTLVPYTNDHYHRLRPTLALPASSLHKLKDDLAMHQALKPLMRVWDQGHLAWVQGLGYPSANRSHFTSIALWESAGDGTRPRPAHGWMTHAIEHRLAHRVRDPHGISLAGDMSLFASDSGRWLSLANLGQLPHAVFVQDHGATVDHPTLAIVQERLQTLDTTLARLKEKLERALPVTRFNGGAFGEQLRQVAMLVSAGVDTPVFRVRLDGFDTHDHQLGRHAQLLASLADGLGSFAHNMKQMGEWDNTLVMTYSEFGRRAAENRSLGTDHGTAAPHLLMGGAVRGGMYGSPPDLGELIEGDPKYTMDYRALYHSILSQGLGTSGTSAALAGFDDPRLSQLIRAL